MKRSVLALSALALLVFASAAFGQAQRGSITVTVVDADGARLPGATVTASSDETLTRRTAVTDGQGVAQLVALDPSINYVVTTSLDGFNTVRNEGVSVRAGRDQPLRVGLSLATVQEELIVTAEAPVVDVTSTVTGQDITLQLTESLPTARSYQDYLQLVPGVMPTVDQGFGQNPASRSGLNYRDVRGEVGTSRDNFYYLEGINVTDGVQGTFGANLNTEIIQEQSVHTGGLPAEFVGAPGLVTNVITKSGGNQFSGSVNYYFQDASLQSTNRKQEDSDFSTFDSAATFGGPIVRDKAWFYTSYRIVSRDDDVPDPDNPGQIQRSVSRDDDQAFGKLTWTPTDRDLFSGIFLSDPYDVSGQNDPDLATNRDFAEDRGGNRWTVNYNRVFQNASFDVGYSDHEQDLNIISALNQSLNDVAFPDEVETTLAETQLGGDGRNNFETRGTETGRGSFEYLADSSWGDHTIKFGAEFTEYTDFRDANWVDGVQHVSISNRFPGLTAEEIANGAIDQTEFDSSNPSDIDGLNDAVQASDPALRQAYLDLLDLNGDGFIDSDEAGQIVFSSTAGNPNGQINYQRDFTLNPGAATTHSEGTVYYLQDTWQWNKWSVNAGIRAEEWEHFATTGERVFTFDFEIAPRVSLVYDLNGDGKQRLSAYYGRYYDPIRNNATNFVGSLTTREFAEQVFIQGGDGLLSDGEWTTFRIRGGQSQQDAFIAPNTQTPYTDELMVGYKRDLGRNMSIEANVIKRETRDIIEDYDLGLYTDPNQYPGPINDPNSLFLGFDYFGYSADPGSNFIIMTLPPGAFRDWDGVELVFRKRFSNNWQMIASYAYSDAEGNTSSDSNFDFAGDVLWLDPRAPGMTGTQPGLVEHLLKVAGSYNFDNGFQLGGQFRYTSAPVVNITSQAVQRNNPVRVDQPFEFAGINSRWVRADAVGGLAYPEWGIFDVRASYLWNINNRLDADFFVDVFNVFDDQTAIQLQDREAGGDGFEFGEGIEFNDPRRFFLGARLRF